jgi:apolipoprotein N-acyltransferase
MNRFRALICRSHRWLAVGLVLFLFSHGRWTIPVCSWFAFVFLIRFHRASSRPWLALVTLWVGMSACHAFMYDGLLPVSGPLFYAACFLFGGIWTFPFIVDRLLYRRLDGLASTFLWPLLMVTINFFLASYLPNLAHSQIEYLSLIQIVSITGMGGLLFLIYWFAGTVNRIWESEFDWTLAKRDGSIFLGALLLVLVYGETRLAIANSRGAGKTLQVAMINLQRNLLETQDNFEPEIVGELFAASKTSVGAGAEVIAWSEANADIPRAYEAELVERGKAFAKENQVFLFMSFRSFSTPRLNENKTIGIAPGGETVVDYLKSHPIPVLEAGTQKGKGEVATADIHGIRTGHVICYDMDFPSFIRQAGRRGVDILFAPSSDWREVRFLHAASARLRAVENGCSLVRPTMQGLSIATDPYGRMLAYHDYYSDTPRISIVGVPSRGVRTVYAMCGDLFSVICIVLFVGLIGLACLKGGATRGDADAGPSSSIAG